MLRQLLKYDFKAIAKSLFPVYLFFLISTFFVSSLFRVTNSTSIALFNNLNFFISLLLVSNAFLWIFMSVYTFYVLIKRYAKSVFGQEGYLTHTLPLSSHKILAIKVLSFVLWVVITGIVSFLSIIIALILNVDTALLNHLFYLLKQIWNVFISIPGSYLAIFTFIINILISLIFSAFIIYFSIGFGARFNFKVLMGIFMFIAINILFSYISDILVNSGMTFINLSLAVFFGVNREIYNLAYESNMLSATSEQFAEFVLNQTVITVWKLNICMLVSSILLYLGNWWTIKHKNI